MILQMKNIVLYGFMGTGKSIVAKRIAKAYGMNYIEMDDEIEKDSEMSISDIFSIKGEGYFRSLERSLIQRLSKSDGNVISTGGGVVLNEKNVIDLGKNGIGICLWATPEVIYERTKDEEHRPLLNVKDPLAKINGLIEKRKSYYKKVKYHIDTTELIPEEVVERVREIVEENSK